MRLGPRLLLLLPLALSLSACGSDGSPDATGPDPTGPTVTGEVTTTQAEADVAMGGLCDLASGSMTEMADVHEAFHTRAHEALHAVGGRVQEVDPAVAATLLEAKSVVETDLEGSTPPPDLPEHTRALVDAFATSLEAVGLTAAACA